MGAIVLLLWLTVVPFIASSNAVAAGRHSAASKRGTCDWANRHARIHEPCQACRRVAPLRNVLAGRLRVRNHTFHRVIGRKHNAHKDFGTPACARPGKHPIEAMAASMEQGGITALAGVVGFSDADAERLRALWPALAPALPSLCARLAVLALDELVVGGVPRGHSAAELSSLLEPRVADLFNAPRDGGYADRRRADGGALVRAGLSAARMSAATARVRDELVRAARNAGAVAAPEDAEAIARACDLDAALLVGAVCAAASETRLADLRDRIVAHLPAGVVLLDADGRVTTAARPNPRVFASAEPHGRPWPEVLQPALVEAAGLRGRLERARRLKREILLPRLDVALPSGVGSFRITLTPLDHPMAELLMHVEDLTDTLASEARVTRAEQLAKLASMAATVAHEIRNPLAGVSAAVQVVANTLPHDDTRRGALTKVQEQVQRLGNLVGDLLSLSKPIALTPRAVDLAAVAASVASSEHGTAEVRGTGSALADVALLTQVLFNLVQNAWQAGARKVRIEVDGATLRVLDDGPGINDEVRERIFEPFFTTKTRGTGLGLPTARKIVEAMGGTLTLCPSPWSGAGFEARLPTDDARGAEDE
ncbi:MAG: ATP-binding protein [Deltaproteobacteria bacterium]|nr:ATP-binding protein [Deltaproteobacteria bacterium]